MQTGLTEGVAGPSVPIQQFTFSSSPCKPHVTFVPHLSSVCFIAAAPAVKTGEVFSGKFIESQIILIKKNKVP